MADPTTDPFENIRLPGKTVTGRRAPRPDGGRILPLPNPGFPSIGAKPVSERTRRAVEAGPVARRRGFDTMDLRDTSSLRTSDLRKADSRPLGSFKPIDTEGADGRSWSQWSDQWQLELGMIDPKEYDRRHGSEYETNRIPVASADDSKTHGERISDAASDAWNHTGLPATLARTAYSRLPAFDPTGTMSREERVAQQGRDVAGDERDYRELRDTRRELDPAGGFAKFIDEAAGGTIGGVDPTYLIGGPAKNVLGRMAVQGGVNAGVDALSQGLDISSGVQDEYDPMRTAAAGVGGAAFEGVATAARHGAGAVRDRFFPEAEAHSPTLEEPVAHQEAPQETPSPEVPASIAAERVKRQPVAQDRSDRIDQLDDLYADPRATPEQKDAYAEEQDRLMAEESAERYAAQEKARPQNDDTPESLHDRVVRHEHDYNQMAFGADDDRRFARRNTRAYKEYHAELSQLEEKYRNSAKELIGAMPIEELRSIAGPIEHSGGPWADEVFNELRNRAELPDEVRDVADGILKEQWEKPTLRQERIGDATKSIDEESARLEEEAAFAKKQERTPAEDVVDRLTVALKNAEKARGDQNKLYAEERSRRFAKARAIREKTGGDEASLKAELAALGGELPKADFEAVRDQFSEDDLRVLFQHLANHPDLDNNMEPLKARVALKKLLDGERPGDAELELLRKVFPKDFIAAALKHRGAGAKIMDVSNNLVNLSFSMMSSADLSAPMRQGVFLIGRKEFWKAWPEMFKQFALGFRKSDEAFDTFMKDLKERPNYELAEQYKLAISDAGQNVHAREERFQSPWAERIPIFGRLNKASGRAYTAFLNKVRMDTFDSFIKLADDAGMDFDEAGKFLKDATGFINAATGRGGLPPVLEKAAPLINGLLFSPRLMSSRLTLLNPLYYPKLHPIVRKEALKALVTFSGIAATVLTLAALSGADVERDTRSSDFGKIKVGNKRFDVLGGFGQYITLFSRIAPFLGGKTKTSSGEIKEIGKDFGSPTRLGVVGNFLRSKSSPIASLGMDYLAGSDVTGKPFQALPSVDKSGVTPGEIADRFMPMIIGDMTDLVKEDGPVGILEGVPGIFGISTQTYNANSPPHSFTVEGEKVTLSPSDYKAFADLSETYSKDMLEQLHETEEFKEATPEEQIKLEKRTRTSARKYAKEDLLADPEADVNLTTKESEEEGEEFTFGVPTSMRRDEANNRRVGGVANSDHLDGNAIDFVPAEGVSWDTLYKEAKKFFPGARVILEPAGYRHGARHGKHVHVQQEGLNAPVLRQ